MVQKKCHSLVTQARTNEMFLGVPINYNFSFMLCIRPLQQTNLVIAET